MIASTEDKNHSHHIVKDDNPESIGLLRTSVIYGANASGKSNLVEAMRFARDFIVDGVDKNDNIPLRKFKLDKACAKKPSRFEFEFRYKKKQYAYGFVVSETKVEEEWLFEIGINKEEKIFERNQDFTVNYDHEIFLGLTNENKEQERIEFETKGTRPNLLFVSNCKERNIEYLIPIYEWFDDILKIITPKSKPFALPLIIEAKVEDFTNLLLDFDFRIEKIIVSLTDLEDNKKISQKLKNKIQKEFPLETKDKIGIFIPELGAIVTNSDDENHPNLTFQEIKLLKKDKDDELIEFELSEESDGTRRFIDFLPMLELLSNDSSVFVVDEIEDSLHILLVQAIFDFFLNDKRNNSFQQSQLIATTHAVLLLGIDKIFRKDEIWFIKKNKYGQSVPYSLANTNVEDLDLVKGYINGRFGAIPLPSLITI